MARLSASEWYVPAKNARGKVSLRRLRLEGEIYFPSLAERLLLSVRRNSSRDLAAFALELAHLD